MKNNKKVLVVLFIIIAFYSIWNGRNLLIGPRINIDSPAQGENILTNPIAIEGTAKNISFISMNGRQIFVDEKGKFKEEIWLLPGENIVEIFGKDRFNKEVRKRLYLNFHK